MTATPVTINADELIPLMRALSSCEAELRRNTNKRLREAAGECARGLLPRLHAAAASAPTPQARIVARTAKVSSDRLPAVKVGGSRKVGRRKTPAGRLVWGSERGGHTFVAARGGSYWLDPAASAYARTAAPSVYLKAVARILSDAGVL
jgi:hypothetical protein